LGVIAGTNEAPTADARPGLALDIRLAMHRRPAGNTLVDALAYLQARAPLPGSVAVTTHWYPTLRYFYEYGAFRSSNRDASLPPHLYRVEAPAHGGSGPGDASE
jgi:hypothetical protein